MKQVCLQCNRQAADGNLWCQEGYCATTRKPAILEYGEQLGDIEIVKLLVVLPTSAVYRARRDQTQVLLKVAHDGCQQQLEREAEFLMETQRAGQHHPMLPTLLPAHVQESLTVSYYSKTVFRGQIKYYSVFQDQEGDVLRETLARNPQPWYRRAGWLTISLADALAFMHKQRRLHLCLSPDGVLVRFDKQKVPRPTLLDLGAVTPEQEIGLNWHPHYAAAAYTAPELLGRGRRGGPASDVYGLGLIFYEMLAGRPAFVYRLRKEDDVRRSVLQDTPAPMNRRDLVGIPAVVEQAISQDYHDRQQDVWAFASDLLGHFPKVPPEKKPRVINWGTVAVASGAALAITLLLVLALLLNGTAF